MALRYRRLPFVALAVLVLGYLAPVGGRAEAALADGAGQIVVYGDMVQGSANVPPDQAATRSCVLLNRFPRNAQIVFRARVVDGGTGQVLTDADIDTLQVQLSNGMVLTMRYGKHLRTAGDEETQYFWWTASWIVPVDYPTGSIDVQYVALAKDGRMAVWQPFAAATSQLTITDDVLGG